MKVATHNLEIKKLYIYLVLITLYFFDPVLHGWTRTLRIINYLPTVPKKVKHKAHLISDENCQICETIKIKWELRTNESDAEKYLFRYETQVIKRCMKTEQIQEFEEIDDMFFTREE